MKTNTILTDLGHMLPHKKEQKLYKWAWRGGVKTKHNIHKI